jgi:chitodextrinase
VATSSIKIILKWTASTDNTGVQKYQVFRNNKLVASPGSNSFTDSGLTASTTYSYTVTAVDYAGNVSPTSTAVNATTLSLSSDTIPPTTPTNLTATATSSSKITLTWTASTDNVGIKNYQVFRNGTLIATITSKSFTDSGLTASTLYSYTVKAVDLAGNVSPASAPASATTFAVVTFHLYLASGSSWTVPAN